MKTNTLAVLALGISCLGLSTTAHAELTLPQNLIGTGVTPSMLVSDQTFNLTGPVTFTKIVPTSMDPSNPGYTAADAPFTSFGLYQAGNPGNKTQLWGNDLTGSTVTLTPGVNPFGLYIDNERLNPPTGATIGGVPGSFYTETGLNSDGHLHAEIFQYNADTWYVAFEDRSFLPGKKDRTTDGDFNDLVVKVEAVPEVNGATLMALGTLGMGTVQLLRQRKRAARRA